MRRNVITQSVSRRKRTASLIGTKVPQKLFIRCNQKPNDMKFTRLLSLLAVSAVLASGCVGPVSRTSKWMQATYVSSSLPPSGKSLVCIHRPRAYQGNPLYTSVWDSKTFIADLGNGHSVAYACDPGKHYFINRSVEVTGVVEAQLLPGQTYDLWVATAGAFIASFKLEPVKPGSKQAALVSKWANENRWVTSGAGAEEYQRSKDADMEKIIQDFVLGPKQGRVQHLAAEDHR